MAGAEGLSTPAGAKQQDGVLVLAKPSGPTSAQCLRVLKRQGQRKIGHAGTLDPLAAGVLLILLGQATKLSGWLLKGGRKIYRGKLRLGLTTDTWDIEGRLLEERPFAHLGEAELKAGVASWLLQGQQEIPAYSAAKYNGQPLYKLARKGQNTPVKIKPIEIYEAEVLNIALPYLTFRVACSSGAYIRSLAHSLGVRLGCGAVLSELTREYSHPFNLKDACPWEAVLDGTWPSYMVSMFEALPEWPIIELDESWAGKVRNGMGPPAMQAGQNAWLSFNGRPIALATRCNERWQIERGLWNN